MKYLFAFFVILSYYGFIFGQESRKFFNNQAVLAEGLYTSLPEILENKPKYNECRFEAKVNVWSGSRTIYYVDNFGVRHEFADTLLLLVEDGNKYVEYKNRLCKLILAGAISTFFIENVLVNPGYEDKNSILFFWDVSTGKKDKLNPSNIDGVFRRDSVFYQAYSEISKSKKSKTLYSYLLKFNERNPIYIK